LFEPKKLGTCASLYFAVLAALVAAILAYLCLETLGLAQEADTSNVTLQPNPAPDVMPFYRDWTQHHKS